MKFYNYLNEQPQEILNPDQITQMLESNCRNYLKDLKQVNFKRPFLLSGRSKNKSPIFKGTVRKNRQPKDTPQSLHDLINDKFEEKFGVRLRGNSLFITGRTTEAKQYGKPYIIFPINEYQVYWSEKVNDLYAYFFSYLEDFYFRTRIYKEEANDIFSYVSTGDISYVQKPNFVDELNLAVDQWKEFREKFLQRLNFIIKTFEQGKMEEGLKTGVEIMLYCNQYYAFELHPDVLNNLFESLKKIGINIDDSKENYLSFARLVTGKT